MPTDLTIFQIQEILGKPELSLQQYLTSPQQLDNINSVHITKYLTRSTTLMQFITLGITQSWVPV